MLSLQSYERGQGRLQPDESLSRDCLRKAFDLWYSQARFRLRQDQTKDEYFMEFMAAWNDVRVPLGEGSLVDIWNATKEAKPPAVATENLSDPRLIRLCTLCRDLQRFNGEKPFYLAVRTVQKLFGLASPRTAHQWMKGLQGLKIIQPVEKGGPETYRATRFRYLPPLDESPNSGGNMGTGETRLLKTHNLE